MYTNSPHSILFPASPWVLFLVGKSSSCLHSRKASFPSEISRFEPQAFLGRKGHLEMAHLLVLSRRHFYLPSKEPGDAPSVHEDFTLRPALKSQERQVTSAQLSCLRENRSIYFGSPESEGFSFVSVDAFRSLLEKLLGNCTTIVYILVCVRLMCSEALDQNRLAQLPQNELKLWKKAFHRLEFSQQF